MTFIQLHSNNGKTYYVNIEKVQFISSGDNHTWVSFADDCIAVSETLEEIGNILRQIKEAEE